jgi:dihydroorotase
MSNVLIKNVKIIDNQSKYNDKIVDILIEKGKIVEIKKGIKSNFKTFEADNLHVSNGWFDMCADFREPGFEQQEDLETGTLAAIKGGFTGVAILPNTNPVLDNKSSIKYILNKSSQLPIDVIPYGAISEGAKGEHLAELYDMNQAGAIAFTDGKKQIKDADLLKRALQYAAQFNGLTLHLSFDGNLSKGGQMNESPTSTSLGLKGIPEIAEVISINRDLTLIDYADSAMHFMSITTEKGVQTIKKAKEKLKISADVSAHHIYFSEEDLVDFDTNFKVFPPLTSKKNIAALIKALKDNTIDVIVSDHQPLDIEHKKVEFDHASFGIIGLQTVFGASRKTLKKHLSLQDLIEKISFNPRRILGISNPKIEVGEIANLTFFNPDMEWVFKENDIVSKSKNTPFIGQKLLGKPLAIYHKGILTVC